ncbi:MAG TPA: C39 family peptidase [Methanosarcina sp.]|nr:C39 family peptidase [Methanosarcina sp.]
MNQKNEAEIGESACCPTSVAMLLNYHYPNIKITGHDVYHSGTQGYTYDGPAVGYKNVSFARGDKGRNIVKKKFRSYYRGSNSGHIIENGIQYLRNYWGGKSSIVSFSDLSTEIEKGPVIVRIKLGGSHYIVLRGYVENTAGGNEDFHVNNNCFFVNDPYPDWEGHPNGNNREFSYSELKSLYMTSFTFVPYSDKEHRQYTTLVDGTDVQLDNINAMDRKGNYIWQEYYGEGGDWYYPTTDGHSVTWTPDLKKEGNYEIHVIFYDDLRGRNIEYSVYSPESPDPIATRSIKRGSKKWRDEILGTFDLKKGSYVRVNDVPKDCNVDAVRFEYVGV